MLFIPRNRMFNILELKTSISVANSVGLRKGAPAPHSLAISVYRSESVETTTLSTDVEARAASMIHAINGRPASGLIFLSAIPFELESAPITART